jgi:cardiolipin synthase (CMP-forming)
MGVYRARDLWRVPGLLSLLRVPFAAAFPLALRRPVLAFAVLCAAALSDVLDGWYARRYRQATPTGAALDPLTDKLFVLTVAIALVLGGRLSVVDVMLLSIREIGELPLVVWIAASQRARRVRAEQPLANLPGKLATALQFATVTGALFRVPALRWMIGATALAGAFAAATYWLRALRSLQAARPGQGQPAS